MSSKLYSVLAALIFTLVAAAQLLRATNGWTITINSSDVPLWASWLAFAVAAFLAVLGFASSRR
jgi:hypothetical protein